MTFEPFDVVTFSFPFVERQGAVTRPVVVLSSFEQFGAKTGIASVAMITSARHSSWPLDVRIAGLETAGLPRPCIVRMKLNSAALERVERKIGTLGEEDRKGVRASLQHLFSGVL